MKLTGIIVKPFSGSFYRKDRKMSNKTSKKLWIQVGYLKGISQVRNKLREDAKALKDHPNEDVYESVIKTKIEIEKLYKEEKNRLCEGNPDLKNYFHNIEINKKQNHIDYIMEKNYEIQKTCK